MRRRGLEANVARAMVLNGTKMSCYDQIKQIIKGSGCVSYCFVFYKFFVEIFIL